MPGPPNPRSRLVLPHRDAQSRVIDSCHSNPFLQMNIHGMFSVVLRDLSEGSGH